MSQIVTSNAVLRTTTGKYIRMFRIRGEEHVQLTHDITCASVVTIITPAMRAFAAARYGTLTEVPVKITRSVTPV